ncbi:MAG: DNA translocase FtsK, partial [bacterium]
AGSFLLLVGKREEIKKAAYFSLGIFLFLSVCLHLTLPLEEYDFKTAVQSAYQSGEGAGLVGALLSFCLMAFLGRVGLYVCLPLGVLLFAFFYFKINLEEIGAWLKEEAAIFLNKIPKKANPEEKKREAKEKAEKKSKTDVPQEEKPLIFSRPPEVKIAELQEKTVVQTKLKENYQLPGIDLLAPKPAESKGMSQREIKENARLLESTLASFGVNAKVVEVQQGPTITRYELQPPAGVKVSKIINLTDDIALALAASGVRIEAPVPGKSVVGIEVPNRQTTMVSLREILTADKFQKAEGRLVVGLGKDIAGNPVITDLTKMPHLLVAGTTGSGKSVCINTIITSILYKASPDEVKFLMIDPKMVELVSYNGIPHLIAPVVTEAKKAAGALKWAVKEMDRRYQIFSEHGVRNISGFNRGEIPLPYIVIIIDELADLMLVAAKEVEDSICRLTQLARAAGIHLVIATQRPSVDVITGVIKSNISSRIAFAVSSQVDSRTILDMAGAEKLLGKGDMLFSPIGSLHPVRVQGAFISDKEVENIVKFLAEQGISSDEEEITITETDSTVKIAEEETDELFYEAIRVVMESKQASASMLQRRLRIGYARAGRLMDILEAKGIIGPYEGSKPRHILVSPDFLQEKLAGRERNSDG